MRSCPWGEGEGGGRKRKTEGKKSQPPTNGEEGTGETLRARPMSRGERLRLGPGLRARRLGVLLGQL